MLRFKEREVGSESRKEADRTCNNYRTRLSCLIARFLQSFSCTWHRPKWSFFYCSVVPCGRQLKIILRG